MKEFQERNQKFREERNIKRNKPAMEIEKRIKCFLDIFKNLSTSTKKKI